MDNKFSRIKTTLWLIFLANLLVAIVKIKVGIWIKSAGLTADGFHSLTDGAANIIGLIAVYLAAKPVDADHPYGHKKFETLAALFISVMLGYLGLKVLSGAVNRLINPVIPEITTDSLLALMVTLGMNIFISIYERRAGKRLGSDILLADSSHTRSDIYISCGVLVTLIGIRLGLPPLLDPLISLVVSVFIFQAALEILRSTCGVLADRAALDSRTVAELVSQFPAVKSVHEIRSRGRADDVYIDLHIETDPVMTVEDSHQLSHEIEAAVRSRMGEAVQMLIHVEPYTEKTEDTL